MGATNTHKKPMFVLIDEPWYSCEMLESQILTDMDSAGMHISGLAPSAGKPYIIDTRTWTRIPVPSPTSEEQEYIPF